MQEDLDFIIEDTEDSMQKAINHLESELVKIRAGKVSPTMLDGITVEYYDAPTPINQVANVTVQDARTLTIQPWEKKMLAQIDRAIMGANIGVPPLTEERRKELFKKASAEGEQAKVAIRNIRRDGIEQIKKLQKDGLSEDIAKGSEKTVQDITDKYIALVEKHLAAKEKEMMTI